jgi:hypothetical protein
MRAVALSVLAISSIALVGCGPMPTGPMPPRLDADQQKQFDDGWEKALTPVDNLDRQTMLDALTITQGFQVGVDRLSFRSEKKFSGGNVVMEIEFERAVPAKDRFQITILDKSGAELRKLTYGRQEVETAFNDFYAKRDNGDLTPEEQEKKQKDIQKRMDAVQKLWSNAKDPMAPNR